MSRKVQYLIFIGGTVLLCGGAFVLALTKVLQVNSGGLLLFGLFWLWDGLLLMSGRHPEYRSWDRWEKQVYGLSLAVMGAQWAVLSFTPVSRQGLACIVSFVPAILLALVGRFWYVEKKRNEEYYKNQTEKD